MMPMLVPNVLIVYMFRIPITKFWVLNMTDKFRNIVGAKIEIDRAFPGPSLIHLIRFDKSGAKQVSTERMQASLAVNWGPKSITAHLLSGLQHLISLSNYTIGKVKLECCQTRKLNHLSHS